MNRVLNSFEQKMCYTKSIIILRDFWKTIDFSPFVTFAHAVFYPVCINVHLCEKIYPKYEFKVCFYDKRS